MTAIIHPLGAQNSSLCILCGQYGNYLNALTHTGYNVGCVFHRICLENSSAMSNGKCPGCNVVLRDWHIVKASARL